ncbi:MAG: helix-turn-helix domain-containing protein [Burkholderiales bacterium]|nr:helix-turn-helix domain-containing protein [Burkholderiales bacterium]
MTTDKKTDARQLGHATLEAMRLRAVEAVKAGVKATDLARAYGVHRRIVFRWLTDFYQGGEQGLKAKPIPGRPPKLDAPQMQSLTLSSVSPVMSLLAARCRSRSTVAWQQDPERVWKWETEEFPATRLPGRHPDRCCRIWLN